MPAGCLSTSYATRTESLLQTEAVLTCPTKGGGSITRVQAKHVPMCYRIPLCACFSCLSAASCRCNGSHAISLIFQTLIGRSRSPNTATFPCPPEGIMDDTTATQCQVSKHLLRYCRISSCGSPAAAVTHLDRHSGPTPAAACLIRIKRSFRSCAGSHRPDGSSSSSSSLPSLLTTPVVVSQLLACMRVCDTLAVTTLNLVQDSACWSACSSSMPAALGKIQALCSDRECLRGAVMTLTATGTKTRLTLEIS